MTEKYFAARSNGMTAIASSSPPGQPNLLIFKRVIKYVHKDGEESAQGGDE